MRFRRPAPARLPAALAGLAPSAPCASAAVASPCSVRSREYSLHDYIKYILSEYKQVLRRIHSLGTRRILLTGVGPIGCVSADLALHIFDGRRTSSLRPSATVLARRAP